MKQAEFIDKITYFQTKTLDKIMKTHKVLFFLEGLKARIKCEDFNGLRWKFDIRVTDEDDVMIDTHTDETHQLNIEGLLSFLYGTISKRLLGITLHHKHRMSKIKQQL